MLLSRWGPPLLLTRLPSPQPAAGPFICRAASHLPTSPAASPQTLYVSKNSLRSLAGVEQFRGLRALSAADNELGDLECLRALPAAGIALEAASFEGNPMADLPNYRAHAIATLGPSLAMLDNRPVGEEERRAAPGAVAHEATMLALMTSNACLVHKLGRAVQLVKLHCELQCAVLGGQYGSAAAAGAGAGPESLPGSSGRGMSRLLQLWDAEGSLGRQVQPRWLALAATCATGVGLGCLGQLQTGHSICLVICHAEAAWQCPLQCPGCHPTRRSGTPLGWPSGARWGAATASLCWREASQRAAASCGSRWACVACLSPALCSMHVLPASDSSPAV